MVGEVEVCSHHGSDDPDNTAAEKEVSVPARPGECKVKTISQESLK